MNIFPAIDLFGSKAVRLRKGDYNDMTVYSGEVLSVASYYKSCGAHYLHAVDLEGARDGGTPNFDTIASLCQAGLATEVGGGIRDEKAVNKYLDAGALRVILGTAAVNDRPFLENMAAKYAGRIAVGVDIADGMVAVNGWTEKSSVDADSFCSYLETIGIKTVIVTDISKDGMLGGTNTELYRQLTGKFSMDIIASGGVSDIDDIKALAGMKLHGAILGRALYEGKIDLAQAIEAAK